MRAEHIVAAPARCFARTPPLAPRLLSALILSLRVMRSPALIFFGFVILDVRDTELHWTPGPRRQTSRLTARTTADHGHEASHESVIDLNLND